MKEKFSKEQRKRESFSGVHIDFFDNLVLNYPDSGLADLIKQLKKNIVEYPKKRNAEPIKIARFYHEDSNKYLKATANITRTMGEAHRALWDLLNAISRRCNCLKYGDCKDTDAKYPDIPVKWRDYWGTINSNFEADNIAKWANEMADYLETLDKNKNA